MHCWVASKPIHCKVSDLWDVRDIWEWLAPGYTQQSTREFALANAAFTSYVGLQKFREFKLEAESSSKEGCRSVGLWAKAYMTTTDYTFLGTLITENSFASVTQGKLPKPKARGVSEQKTKRESTILQKLQAATKGPFKDQFSQNRLADAIAMCHHQWSHFITSGGRLQADRRWLPSELAAQMKRDGCRGLQSPQSQLSGQVRAERSDAQVLLDDVVESVPHVSQRAHFGRTVFGLSSGVPVRVIAQKNLTPAEFNKRLVTPGSFVISRPAPGGTWAKNKPKLTELAFWMWNIIRVIRPGEAIPGFKKPAETFVYDAHLFQPRKGRTGSGSWSPLFTDDRVLFMRTPAEKARRKRRRLALWGTDKQTKTNRGKGDLSDAIDVGEFLKPIRCFLRPENIVGGGFGRTATGAIPNAIQKHALAVLAATA